nr:PREDICTED: selenoprotein Pb-like [Struthio camelus australis]
MALPSSSTFPQCPRGPEKASQRPIAGLGGRRGIAPLSPFSSALALPHSCARLAFHIQLPYSFLHFPYVESAIRFTYSKDFCGNCSLYPNSTQEANSTMVVPANPSPLPEQEKEPELPIHQHNPLHPHHHVVSSEKASDPSGDHQPAAHGLHRHRDHGKPNPKRQEQKEQHDH